MNIWTETSYFAHGAGACKRHPGILIGVIISLMTLAVYAQSVHFEFLHLDDRLYVLENPHVRGGLTLDGLAWSFGFDAKPGTYWHPMTWISHMLDVEFFGLDPGAHHLTNVGLHLVNALLLFLCLSRLSGAPWLSGMVAALFAVHPINVESVAWVAERKNLLSTTFWMLTMLFYAAYARRPGIWRYFGVAVAFGLGLLTKPMLATLPGALLLLDFWPLKRFGGLFDPANSGGTGPLRSGLRNIRRWLPLFEKIPLLALSSAAVWLAVASLADTTSPAPSETIPMSLRLQNALVTYVTYMAHVAVPEGLAMFYPYPTNLPWWRSLVALLVLAAISALALRTFRMKPWFVVGWLWFLGTLVPVSGIVQAGLWPAWADRWAYVPAIGLFIVLVWGAKDLLNRSGIAARSWVVHAAIGLLMALAFAGNRQAAIWKNDVTLYQNAVAKVEKNYFAYSNLGETLYRRGRIQEAEGSFVKALEYAPHFVPAHIGLANTMLSSGRIEKAFDHYATALQLNPHEKAAYNNLGVLLLQTGRFQDAILAFEKALNIDADYAEAHNNIGFAYLKTGRLQEAKTHIAIAMALEPDNQMAKANQKELMALEHAN